MLLALAIQAAFQQLGRFSRGYGAPYPLDESESVPLEDFEVARAAKNDLQQPLDTTPADPIDAVWSDEANLVTLQQELQQALQSEIAAHTIALHRENEGLVISLREFGFFDSGSSGLKPSALPALDRIASILSVRTCKLRIEGHTDNVPIHTPQMATNWELSTARATELVRLLILRYSFAPERLSAAGYAQYHPIASNETPQGRSQNRRVDLVILGGRPLHPPTGAAAPSKPSPSVP